MSYRTDRFVSWDIGGPLRDSSHSMIHSLKKAASEHGYDLALNNRLAWQLWTIKGSKLPGEAGDYRAWFAATFALQTAASVRLKSSDDFCLDLFGSEDPSGSLAHVVSEYPLHEDAYGPVGDRARFLFGKDPETIALSPLNY